MDDRRKRIQNYLFLDKNPVIPAVGRWKQTKNLSVGEVKISCFVFFQIKTEAFENTIVYPGPSIRVIN